MRQYEDENKFLHEDEIIKLTPSILLVNLLPISYYIHICKGFSIKMR